MDIIHPVSCTIYFQEIQYSVYESPGSRLCKITLPVLAKLVNLVSVALVSVSVNYLLLIQTVP